MITDKTYFVLKKGKYYRVEKRLSHGMGYAAEQIIVLQDDGRGQIIKDRRQQRQVKYIPQGEMLMLALQASPGDEYTKMFYRS